MADSTAGWKLRRGSIACVVDTFAWLLVSCIATLYPLQSRAVEVVYPVADGTLADGGVFGDYDGVVDSWSWEFESKGISGAVTLAMATPGNAVDQRIVCEYDLRSVSLSAPVVATLTFTTRGVSVFPFPDVPLQVYSYPADLIESPSDFSAGPAAFQGSLVVAAMQTPATVALDVTEAVNAALFGSKKVAFRFQIDPSGTHADYQVFIDGVDAEPMTKPTLTIGSALAGDADSDGDVDLDDFAVFADCLTGPGVPPAPSMPGVGVLECTWTFDRDADADVDLRDLSAFLGSFARGEGCCPSGKSRIGFR